VPDEVITQMESPMAPAVALVIYEVDGRSGEVTVKVINTWSPLNPVGPA
jgi:hypothetical protein